MYYTGRLTVKYKAYSNGSRNKLFVNNFNGSIIQN